MIQFAAHSAGMVLTNTDLVEFAFGLVRLSPIIIAPASQRAIHPHSTGMKTKGTDLVEFAFGRVRLSTMVGSPASQAVVITHPAGMLSTGTDLVEFATGWSRLSKNVPSIAIPPTGDDLIAADTADMIIARIDLEEPEFRYIS